MKVKIVISEKHNNFSKGLNMSIDYKGAGKRIKIARINKEFSQERLAGIVGISATYMSNIESGSVNMSLSTAVAIANALGISLDELMCGSIIKNKHIHVKDIRETLDDCNDNEARILSEILTAAKAAIRKHNP